MNDDQAETRQERREKKLEKRKERMQQHGRSLAKLYKEAIFKQIDKLRADKQKRQS